MFVGDASPAFEDLADLAGSDAGDAALRLDIEQHYVGGYNSAGEPLVDLASVTHVSGRQVLDEGAVDNRANAVGAVSVDGRRHRFVEMRVLVIRSRNDRPPDS